MEFDKLFSIHSNNLDLICRLAERGVIGFADVGEIICALAAHERGEEYKFAEKKNVSYYEFLLADMERLSGLRREKNERMQAVARARWGAASDVGEERRLIHVEAEKSALSAQNADKKIDGDAEFFISLWQSEGIGVVNPLAIIRSPRDFAAFFDRKIFSREEISAAFRAFISAVKSGAVEKKYLPQSPDRWLRQITRWISHAPIAEKEIIAASIPTPENCPACGAPEMRRIGAQAACAKCKKMFSLVENRWRDTGEYAADISDAASFFTGFCAKAVESGENGF